MTPGFGRKTERCHVGSVDTRGGRGSGGSGSTTSGLLQSAGRDFRLLLHLGVEVGRSSRSLGLADMSPEPAQFIQNSDFTRLFRPTQTGKQYGLIIQRFSNLPECSKRCIRHASFTHSGKHF